MKALKPILILCIAICFTTSCKKEVDMTVMQKTLFENADIRQIEIGDAWQVTIVADTVTFVQVEYSAYLENYLKTKLEGTKLEIGFTGNVYPVINSVYRATVHTNHVTLFEKLEAKEAALVKCEGVFTFKGQQLELHLSDAAQCDGLIFLGESCEIKMENASLLTGFQFVGNTATAVLEDASQFNGRIQVDESLQVELNDASRFVNKDGTTQQVLIKLQNSSLLNMAETEVQSMNVDLSSGSEATVHITGLLEGSLIEASTLFYKGHPLIQVDCSDDSQLIPF